MLAGEVVASVALTEPGGGSDLVRSVAATARSEPDGWVLRGEKTFITNAPLADVLVVLARTTPGTSALGLTLFLVPTDLPGVVVTPLTTAGLHIPDRTGELRGLPTAPRIRARTPRTGHGPPGENPPAGASGDRGGSPGVCSLGTGTNGTSGGSDEPGDARTRLVGRRT